MRYVDCNLCGSDNYMLIDSHRKDRYSKPEKEFAEIDERKLTLAQAKV